MDASNFIDGKKLIIMDYQTFSLNKGGETEFHLEWD